MLRKFRICDKLKFNFAKCTKDMKIDLSIFLDAATLREVDYDSSLESSKIFQGVR